MALVVFDALIALLIDLLGNSSWPIRERAYRTLAGLVPLATRQLERATRHSDTEIAHRVGHLYRPIHEARMETLARSLRKTHPWLHLADSYELHYWVELAEKTGAAPGKPWLNYRAAARLWATAKLLERWTVAEVNAELLRMEREECEWERRYGEQRE